jgi:quercetin dioxygenase-like cupin family protein
MSVRALSLVAVATALVAVGCGTKAGGPTAEGFDSATMAQGVFANIQYTDPGTPDYTPTTPLYLSILDFPQAPGENAPTGGHAHPSGFVYGLTGTTHVNVDDGTQLPVGPGQALFAPPFVHHTHSNPGNDPNGWLFIGLRTDAARTKPLPSP